MVAAVASELFDRASDCLDRGEADAARGLIDEGLERDPNSEEGRQLLEHVLRREGRFTELLDRLLAIAKRAERTSRASALKDVARLAAGPLSAPAQRIERCAESLPVFGAESAIGEAVARAVRPALLDVAAGLVPEMAAEFRAERLSGLADQARELGDRRLALECRAAAFSDARTRDR